MLRTWPAGSLLPCTSLQVRDFELFIKGFGVGDGGPGRERKQVIMMEQWGRGYGSSTLLGKT